MQDPRLMVEARFQSCAYRVTEKDFICTFNGENERVFFEQGLRKLNVNFSAGWFPDGVRWLQITEGDMSELFCTKDFICTFNGENERVFFEQGLRKLNVNF